MVDCYRIPYDRRNRHRDHRRRDRTITPYNLLVKLLVRRSRRDDLDDDSDDRTVLVARSTQR